MLAKTVRLTFKKGFQSLSEFCRSVSFLVSWVSGSRDLTLFTKLGVRWIDLARARRCKSNSGKSELGKKIYLFFRAERRGNGPLGSSQESEGLPCTSWVKQGHVLTKKGRDMTKVNTSTCKFKEENNNQSCSTMQKESS